MARLSPGLLLWQSQEAQGAVRALREHRELGQGWHGGRSSLAKGLRGAKCPGGEGRRGSGRCPAGPSPLWGLLPARCSEDFGVKSVRNSPPGGSASPLPLMIAASRSPVGSHTMECTSPPILEPAGAR